jgi:uncharacterized RDD family membrane protein YckC
MATMSAADVVAGPAVLDPNLAARSTRLIAVIIDSAIVGVVFGILAAIMGAMGAMIDPETGSGAGGMIAVGGLMAIIGIAYTVYVIYTLTKFGQTPGKKIMGIKIVKYETGENGGFVPNVLLRYFVNGLLGAIPMYQLVDVCLIFRDDRRCIHDLLAGTKVVRA